MTESCVAHDHICLIYETREEQLAAVVPFLKIGLERREKCLYIVDENTPEIILAALREDGVDTNAALASGALTILDRNQAYLKNGNFDPDWMIAHLKELIATAEAEGFTSFRVTGETTWALRPPNHIDPLIEYECRLNDFFPHENVVAICQYNRARFRPETLLHVIRTHPFVVCGDLVCENPHYVPPEVFDPMKYDAAAEVQRLLDSITENAQLKRELAAEVEQAHLLAVETARWRQLYEAVLANTPDLGYIFDLDHRFTFANGALLAMWGRTWDEAIGKTCLDLGYEPWHAAMHDREIDQVIATRQPVRGEVPFTGANGRRIYDYILFPVIGPTGDVEAVAGSTRDITDLKNIEEALRQSEERYRELLEALPVAVYATDANGVVTLYNQAAARFAGWQPETGKDKWCVTHRLYRPDGTFLPHDECPMAVSLLTGEPQHGVEAIAERPDGTRTWFVPYPTLLRDASGKITGGINVLVDTTERKRAEESLRESEHRLEADLADMQQLQSIGSEIAHEENTEGLYEKLLDAAIAIMRSDFGSMQMLYPERGAEGELRLLTFRGFNPQAAKFWEWVRIDSESTCGAALRTRQRVVVPDIDQCDWMAGTADYATYRQTGIRAVQTTPLISRDGKLLGMISTHWREPHQPSERDLRLLDIAARQAADLLDRKLAAERQKTAEAALRKSERFAAAGRMAATIAHEINNPLEAIVNLCYLLSQENLSPVAREIVRSLDTELDRVSHIAKQTLEFYRNGKTAGPLDLAQSINAAVMLFSRKAETGGVKIETDYRTSSKVFGFPGELRQVFANLINNALEAGATSIRIRASRSHDPAGRNRTGVRVVVADNGTGIPADTVKKLFQPFFTTKEEKGTGLGLWVSKGIVQKHEGWIRMHTSTRAAHRGTTFCMFLPTLHEGPVHEQSN